MVYLPALAVASNSDGGIFYANTLPVDGVLYSPNTTLLHHLWLRFRNLHIEIIFPLFDDWQYAMPSSPVVSRDFVPIREYCPRCKTGAYCATRGLHIPLCLRIITATRMVNSGISIMRIRLSFANTMHRSPLRAAIVVRFRREDRAPSLDTLSSAPRFSSVRSLHMTSEMDRGAELAQFFGGVDVTRDAPMTGDQQGYKRPGDYRGRAQNKASRQTSTFNGHKGKGKGRGGRDPIATSTHDQDEEADLGEIRETLRLLTRALVRHEDAVQTLRLDTGLVWFAQTDDGRPNSYSIIPFLQGVAKKWQNKECPEMSSRPLREVMFLGIIQRLLTKLKEIEEDSELAHRCQQAGWLSTEKNGSIKSGIAMPKC